jgi:hypothetical protein
VDISKSKEKKYDINIRESISYNSTTNSQSTSATHFFTNSAGIDATVYYKKTWSLNMEYELVSRQKTTQFSSNLNNQLWNAKLQKTFRKDEFTIYLKVRDILNQNIGITRNAYSNTFTEDRNDRLKRYWLLGFAWNFKNKAVAGKK